MDLSTSFLGLQLKNPVVPSSSPLSYKLSTLKEMEDAGAAAVVMYSLFEEQIELEVHSLDRYLTHGTESYAEAVSYFPDLTQFQSRPDAYLEDIRKAKEALSIPVIGSLNGISTGGWIRYAKMIEQAGADAIELNMYFLSTDPEMRCDQVEDMYANLLVDIRRSITIPIAVKLSPFFSALPNFARRLVRAGANGLVLFNRFYQPDIDIEGLDVVPSLTLSDSDELRLPLRWIAILYGQVDTDLALMSGVHTAEDVIKSLMAGAGVAMMASELLRKGARRIHEILLEIENWLVEHEYESVRQLRGSMSQQSVAAPAAFVRANYMRMLQSFSLEDAR